MAEGYRPQSVDIDRYEVLGQDRVTAIIALGAHLFATGKMADKRLVAFGQVLPSYTDTELLVRRAMAAG